MFRRKKKGGGNAAVQAGVATKSDVAPSNPRRRKATDPNERGDVGTAERVLLTVPNATRRIFRSKAGYTKEASSNERPLRTSMSPMETASRRQVAHKDSAESIWGTPIDAKAIAMGLVTPEPRTPTAAGSPIANGVQATTPSSPTRTIHLRLSRFRIKSTLRRMASDLPVKSAVRPYEFQHLRQGSNASVDPSSSTGEEVPRSSVHSSPLRPDSACRAQDPLARKGASRTWSLDRRKRNSKPSEWSDEPDEFDQSGYGKSAHQGSVTVGRSRYGRLSPPWPAKVTISAFPMPPSLSGSRTATPVASELSHSFSLQDGRSSRASTSRQVKPTMEEGPEKDSGEPPCQPRQSPPSLKLGCIRECIEPNLRHRRSPRAQQAGAVMVPGILGPMVQRPLLPHRGPPPNRPLPPTPPTPGMKELAPKLPSFHDSFYAPILPPTPVSPPRAFGEGTRVKVRDEEATRENSTFLPSSFSSPSTPSGDSRRLRTGDSSLGVSSFLPDPVRAQDSRCIDSRAARPLSRDKRNSNSRSTARQRLRSPPGGARPPPALSRLRSPPEGGRTPPLALARLPLKSVKGRPQTPGHNVTVKTRRGSKAVSRPPLPLPTPASGLLGPSNNRQEGTAVLCKRPPTGRGRSQQSSVLDADTEVSGPGLT